MKPCSILISSFRGQEATELCIESILKRTKYSDYGIIVYDSSGPGRDEDYLREQERRGNIKLFVSPTPVDHGYAIEQLLSVCNTDYACILDSDVEILEKHWLGRLAEKIINSKILGVGTLRVGSKVFIPDNAYAPVYWVACLFLNMSAYREFGFSGKWRHGIKAYAEYPHKDDLYGVGDPKYIYYDTGADFTEKILYDNPGEFQMVEFPSDFWKKNIWHYGAISRNWNNRELPKIKDRLTIIKAHLDLLRSGRES